MPAGASQGPPAREAIEACLDLHRVGSTNQALARLDDLITEHPNSALLHNIAGALLADTGVDDQAENRFRTALAVRPEFADAHHNLGLVLLRLGRISAAIECFDEAIRLNPDLAPAHGKLGEALASTNQWAAAVASYEEALRLQPDLASAHEGMAVSLAMLGDVEAAINSYDCAGACFARDGRTDAAVRCYEQMAKLNPALWQAHQNLGTLLIDLGDSARAAQSLREALQLDPGNESIAFQLSVVSNELPDSMPDRYIRAIFDRTASGFENNLLTQLEYDAPALMRRMLNDRVARDGNFVLGVDLGCGTGISGRAFRDCCRHLVGIDLSENMLEIARAKSIYDQLVVGDILGSLSSLEAHPDLVIAADVFIYVGALESVFQAIADRARAGSLFVFSTEHLEGNGFAIQRSLRFAHSYNYIAEIAAACGFVVEKYDQCKLRKEDGKWLTGGLYVLSLANKP